MEEIIVLDIIDSYIRPFIENSFLSKFYPLPILVRRIVGISTLTFWSEKIGLRLRLGTFGSWTFNSVVDSKPFWSYFVLFTHPKKEKK